MFKKSSDSQDITLSWGSETDRSILNDERWPRDTNGNREQAVLIAHIPDFNNEIDLAINMLSAYGIPSFKSYNNEGSLGKLLIGTSAYNASLYVPSSMAEDALALLNTPAEEAAQSDPT